MSTFKISYLLSQENAVQALPAKLDQLISRGNYLQQNSEDYAIAIRHGGRRAEDAQYELNGKCRDYNELLESVTRNARAAVEEIDAFIEFTRHHKLTMLHDELTQIEEMLKHYASLQDKIESITHSFRVNPKSMPSQTYDFNNLLSAVNRCSTKLQELISYQAPSMNIYTFL